MSDPTKSLNPRPKTAQAYDVPPDRHLWKYAVRRRDRFPYRVERVNVSYSRGSALSRDITTPWDGVRAATLFLRDDRELSSAEAMGWRENITAAWDAHAASASSAPPAAPKTTTTAPAPEPKPAPEPEPEPEPEELEEASVEPAEAPTMEQIAAAGDDYRALQALAKEYDISPKQSARKLISELTKLATGE